MDTIINFDRRITRTGENHVHVFSETCAADDVASRARHGERPEPPTDRIPRSRRRKAYRHATVKPIWLASHFAVTVNTSPAFTARGAGRKLMACFQWLVRARLPEK